MDHRFLVPDHTGTEKAPWRLMGSHVKDAVPAVESLLAKRRVHTQGRVLRYTKHVQEANRKAWLEGNGKKCPIE